MKRAVGIAAVAVLIFDVAWPLTYRALPAGGNVVFVAITIANLMIPFAAALVIAREASIRNAVVASSALGALDATIGWTISRSIAPELPEEPLTLWAVLTTIPMVVLSYAAVGTVAALIGRRLRKHHEAPAR